jgi:hypothetical protein
MEPPVQTVPAGEVRLLYLGVGGHLLRHGEDALLMAPSFTNPTFGGLPPVLTRMKTDEARVERLLADVPGLSQVDMVLVGHAHYDHLMDVPYILRRYMPSARVYGSRTMGHILAPEVPRANIQNVEDSMAVGTRPGKWHYSRNERIRVMALRSEHAPHVPVYKAMTGDYTEDLPHRPRSMVRWLEGQTLAYLVDLLDGEKRPVFRLLYQDAAGNPALGFLPTLPEKDRRPVDVAILCVASHDYAQDYPRRVLGCVKPRNLVLGHWEDFFGNDPANPEVVRLTDAEAFIQKLAERDRDAGTSTPWLLPKPFSEMRFPVGGGESTGPVTGECPAEW